MPVAERNVPVGKLAATNNESRTKSAAEGDLSLHGAKNSQDLRVGDSTPCHNFATSTMHIVPISDLDEFLPLKA
jgi:hypothetical protein